MSQLLRSLAKWYRARGYNICSDVLDECNAIPESWEGPKPDLVSTNRSEIHAVCVESKNTLRNTSVAEKWRAILKNENVKLMVVIKDRESLELAKSIAQSNNIKITLQMRKKSHRKNSRARSNRFRKSSKTDWLVLATFVVVLLVFLVFYFPSILSYFKLKEFYQPFDQERQNAYMEKQKEKMSNMSEGEKRNYIRDQQKSKDKYKEHIEKIKR